MINSLSNIKQTLATIHFGVELDKNSKPLTDDKDFNLEKELDIIKDYAVKNFGGYTLIECQGGWKKDKIIMHEKSVKLEVYLDKTNDDLHILEMFTDLIRENLKQDLVMLRIQEIDNSYLYLSK